MGSFIIVVALLGCSAGGLQPCQCLGQRLFGAPLAANLSVHLQGQAEHFLLCRYFECRVAMQEVRYGYLFAGLNTSGKVCTVATEAGRSVALEPASHLQPLERLLTGGMVLLPTTTPRRRARVRLPDVTRCGVSMNAPFRGLILTLEGTTRSTPCEISLRRETSILWDTGESGHELRTLECIEQAESKETPCFSRRADLEKCFASRSPCLSSHHAKTTSMGVGLRDESRVRKKSPLSHKCATSVES
eukprot:4359231-Amphidinium_carterae.1